MPAITYHLILKLSIENIYIIYGYNTLLNIHGDIEIKYIEQIIDPFATKIKVFRYYNLSR